MTDDKLNDLAKSIRTMLCGIIITEYGLRGIPDQQFDLKNKINMAIRKCLDVQNFFQYSRNARQEIKDVFKQEFNSGKMVLMAEIMESIYKLDEDSLEKVLESLK
jgi:hypothetical protein